MGYSHLVQQTLTLLTTCLTPVLQSHTIKRYTDPGRWGYDLSGRGSKIASREEVILMSEILWTVSPFLQMGPRIIGTDAPG